MRAGVSAAHTRAEIELVAKAINTEGKRALAIAADVTRREDVEQIVERTTGEFGTIDILVNNAGTIIVKPLVLTVGRSPTMAEFVPGFDQGIADDNWYRILETNITSVYRCCQAVAPRMMAQQRGRIINISSTDADHGLPYAAAYCASKGAVKSFD